MKMIAALAVIGLVAVPAIAARAAEHSDAESWLGLENCAICKTMVENEELMKKAVWETHKIENGALSVMTVPKELVPDFEACCEKMEAVIKKAMTGEPIKLCGHCESIGKLMQSGAKIQQIKTSRGAIDLITSDDPAVVKLIHEHAEKTIQAQKELEEQETKTALR